MNAEVVGGAGIGAALAATETLFRLARRRYLPGDWFDSVLDRKSMQVRDLAAAGFYPETVAVGHSMVYDMFYPDTFSGIGSGQAYNAGATFAIWEAGTDWLRFVLSVWRPSVVLLGFHSFDLNEHGIVQADVAARHAESRAGRRHGEPTRRSLRSRSAVAAAALRSPREVLRFARRGRSCWPPAAQHVGPLGIDEEKIGRAYECNDGFRRAFVDRWLARWTPGDRQIALIHRSIDLVMSHGAEPVILIPPTGPDYAGLHPGGVKDVEAAFEIIGAIADRRGTSLILLDDGEVPADHFADPIHLNDRGAERCSRRLREQLAAR